MKLQYKEWIRQHVGDALGNCKEYSEAMARAFPELKVTRGHYYCPTWGRREHWWLTDVQNEVVDPTMMQFPSMGTGKYEEWEEGAKEPTGKCINCGDYCYGGSLACCPACSRKLEEYYGVDFKDCG